MLHLLHFENFADAVASNQLAYSGALETFRSKLLSPIACRPAAFLLSSKFATYLEHAENAAGGPC